MDDTPEESTVLAEHLARAEADLVAATDGASLCRIGNGPGASSAKHAEGRYAALRELRSLLRPAGTDALASVVGLLDRWRAARAEAVGPAWIAYRTGGVTELQTVLEDLTAATRGVRP